MRTRRSNYGIHQQASATKKLRSSSTFDLLPDDLLLSIFISLSCSASSPADLINAMQTCKRFSIMAMHPSVLANASLAAMTIKASAWCEGAHTFLKHCADAGNIEACYTLGMIRFYCLKYRCGGTSLMAKAAIASHPNALHSLAVIHFNGSGGTRKDKDLKAGVALCARAAVLGHIDAIRELGHCLQDGYGIPKNILEGRRLLLQANAREAAEAVMASSFSAEEMSNLKECTIALGCLQHHILYEPLKKNPMRIEVGNDGIGRYHPYYRLLLGGGCSLLSDFGCNVPPQKLHMAHQFLVDWFAMNPPSTGLRLCSYANCGRPETRKHEFRRCSACGAVNYCSRACQALDWKLCHKYDCSPHVHWEDNNEEEDGEEEEEDMDAI